MKRICSVHFHTLPAGTVPGRGTTFVYLSTLVPAIKEKIEDAEERLGVDIIQKLQVLTTQAIVDEKAQPKAHAAAGAQQGGFSV
ncbi:RuBisCO large subunit-binding protein subunit alpha [Tanacetum coccineum]